jgi:hypothetical protein
MNRDKELGFDPGEPEYPTGLLTRFRWLCHFAVMRSDSDDSWPWQTEHPRRDVHRAAAERGGGGGGGR